MGNIQVVVMGRNYTSLLGMARSAGEAGCDVTVIRTVRKLPKKSWKAVLTGEPIEAKSKFVKKHLYAIEPDGNELVKLLLSEFNNMKEKVILLPTDDFVASTIDKNQEKLVEKFLFPHINYRSGACIRLMDKDIQKQLAKEVGLNVVDGWVVEVNNNSYNLPDGIIYPCFTKPQISFMGDKNCMKRCNNEEELRAVIDEVAKKADCPILVEQFIQIKKEYGVLGFCDGGKSIIPGIVDKLMVGNGAHKGVTLLGCYSPVENYGVLVEKLRTLMAKTQFTGLFDIDLYESNGKIYFNELNLRFGAFGFAAMCAGLNLPELLIKQLQGKKYSVEECKLHKSVICVSEKVNLDDYEKNYMSWEEYKAIRKKADYGFIEYEKDITPYRAFRRKERIVRLKHMIRKR